MISNLIGFYCWETKETADFPKKEKITIVVEDREHVADMGNLYMDISFDRDKVIIPDMINKFSSIEDLKDSLGKLISFDYGKYNGARYGKSFDKLSL